MILGGSAQPSDISGFWGKLKAWQTAMFVFCGAHVNLGVPRRTFAAGRHETFRSVLALVNVLAGVLLKKLVSVIAVLVAIIVAFHLLSSSSTSVSAQTSSDQSANSQTATVDSPEMRKAKADAAATTAEIDKFVTEHANDVAGAAEQNPQLSSRFGSRPPRACPKVTSPPSAGQAAGLIQCTMDYETPQQAKLHQDIAVRLGSPRNPTNSDRWPGIDSRFPVVDLSANATVYLCGPVLEAVMHNTGSNCDRYQFQSAPGICWKNLDGGYRCQINAGLPTNPTRSQGPPTSY